MGLLLVEMISGRTDVRHGACRLVFLVKPWTPLMNPRRQRRLRTEALPNHRYGTTSRADRGLLWGPRSRKRCVSRVKVVASRAGQFQTTVIGPRDDLRSSCASWKRFLHATKGGTHTTKLASQRHALSSTRGHAGTTQLLLKGPPMLQGS
jgi:hypothetical protein